MVMLKQGIRRVLSKGELINEAVLSRLHQNLYQEDIFMRKLVAGLLSAAMVFSLTACSSKAPAESTGAAAPAASASSEETTAQESGNDVNWPTGNVMIYVPGQAGANMDIKARLVAKYLTDELGVPVVIENRAGAGGITACTQYLTEEPNSNNIQYMSGSNLSVAPIYNEVEYTEEDFEIVAGLDSVENGLFVNAGLDIHSLEELKEAFAGKTIKFASAGVGNDSFLVSKILMEEMGLQSDSINGNGFSDALVACMSGTADVAYCALNQARQYVEDGSIVPLAVYSKDDYTGYEDLGYEAVPSLVHEGYDITYSAISYFSLRGGTDEAIVAKLEKALRNVYENPDFQEEFKAAGFVMLPDTSAQAVNGMMDKIIADVQAFADKIS